MIAHHQEFSEEAWALSVGELKKLLEMFHIFTPATLAERYKYLFEESWPEAPEMVKTNEMPYQEKLDYIATKRQNAVHEIFEKENLNGLLKLSLELSNILPLASAAVDSQLDQEVEKEILLLLSRDQTNKLNFFAQKYIYVKAVRSTEDWVNQTWEIIRAKNKDEEIQALFFLSLPQRMSTWNLLGTATESISKYYWQKVSPEIIYGESESNAYLIDQLQKVGRYTTIFQTIAYNNDNIPSLLLAEILKNAASSNINEDDKINRRDVCKIFERLYAHNDLPMQEMKSLEWLYLSHLTDFYSPQKPQILLQELTDNAEFFVEVVGYAYRPDAKNESEDEIIRWLENSQRSRRLLDSWRNIPGMSEEGVLDEEVLCEWVRIAKIKAQETHRVYGVESEIGNLLACYPRNPTNWPPDIICEILDSFDDEAALSHFKTEVFNGRGLTVRQAYEGGDQERALASYFEKMGRRINSRYPRTASTLLELARGYYRDAKDEDQQAHLDELR